MEFQRVELETNWGLTDVIGINDFSKEQILTVLNKAHEMESLSKKQKAGLLNQYRVATLFFEPSTRTRLSFETAAHNLGASIVGFAEPKSSSFSKGESLSDTIRMAAAYADCIVVRHFLEGAARRAAEVSQVPIINAGDGANHHPTQALLDLFTLQKKMGRLDRLKIAMVGDLKYGRAVKSTALGLSNFSDNEFFLVSPDSLQMPAEFVSKLQNRVRIHQTTQIEDIIQNVDVMYVTRIQRERFSDPYEFEKVQNVYRVTPETIALNPQVGIMHALPRVNEIATECDILKNAWYFEQAANGVPTREALLYLLSEVKK